MKRFVVAATVVFGLLFPVGVKADTNPAVADTPQSSPTVERTGPQGAGDFFRNLLSGNALKRKPKQTEIAYTREWVDARPSPTGDANWRCLSEALYFEARGETVKGQFAVAEVIMNRVESDLFPGTTCGVIRQGTGRKFQCQFTYTCDGRKEVIAEKKAYERVSKVARATMDGADANLTGGATYYHTSSVRPRWARRFTETARIGVHIFYRPDRRTAATE